MLVGWVQGWWGGGIMEVLDKSTQECQALMPFLLLTAFRSVNVSFVLPAFFSLKCKKETGQNNTTCKLYKFIFYSVSSFPYWFFVGFVQFVQDA